MPQDACLKHRVLRQRKGMLGSWKLYHQFVVCITIVTLCYPPFKKSQRCHLFLKVLGFEGKKTHPNLPCRIFMTWYRYGRGASGLEKLWGALQGLQESSWKWCPLGFWGAGWDSYDRWWFCQIFLEFSPRSLGKMNLILTSIFFKGVETTN